MKINIKFLDGNILNLDIEKNKIYDIKNEISVIKDIDIHKIKLIFGGKILKNEETIDHHKIYENCTLNCIISKVPVNPSVTNENTENNSNTNENTENNNNTNENPNFNTGLFTNLFNSMNINDSQTFANTLFNSNNTTQFVNMISNNDQLRNHIIDSSIQRMNLPLNSPLRDFFETNINLLTQTPELLNQFANNNFDPPPYSPLDQNIESFNDENSESNNNDTDNDEENIDEDNNNDYENYDDDDDGNDSDDDDDDDDDNDDEDNNENFYNELKEKYSSQFEEVKNMGFEDDELILKTLLQCHGSVAITINKLVEM